MPTVHDIAEYFIDKSEKCGMTITHLKLQKMCYYAQAWHLAIFGKRLFKDEFEAWVHGPVNIELYYKYKDYGWNPIKINNPSYNIERDQRNFLNEVWDVYGKYDAKVLETLTHQETPWLEARKGLKDYEYSNKTIEESHMQRFYRSRLKTK